VPAGGTAGQFLTKIDGTNYNTDWTTLNVSAKRDLTDYDFTNVANTPLNTFGVLVQKTSVMPEALYNTYLNGEQFNFEQDYSFAGTVAGQLRRLVITPLSVDSLFQVFDDVDGTIIPGAGVGFLLDSSGLRFKDASGGQKPNSIRYDLSSITFGDNSTQTIAFPGFNNAALTGNSTAVTPAFGDNDTSIATTAFVQAGLLGGTANARNLEVYVRNQSGASIPAGSIVYISGATGNRPLITLSQANNDANSAQTMGFTKTTIANNAFGYVIVRGEVENLDTSALTEGDQLYLSPTVAGAYTTTKPVAPQHMVYVGIVIRSHPTLGTILVAVQNGYELGEIHDVALGTLVNNDLLVYESSTDLWKNKSFATLGLATTAFVTASNPDASTTVKGHVELATDVEARTSTNTTTTLTPSSAIWQRMSSAFLEMTRANFGYAAVGTMGTFISGAVGSRMVLGTAGACSGRLRVFGASQVDQTASMMSTIFNYINFSKPIYCSGRAWPESTITDPNVTAAWYFGKSEANGAGDLNRKGFGWEIIGDATTRYLTLVVHDGTTLTKVTSSHVVISGVAGAVIFEWDVVSDGAGNVTLYVNGASVATTALGPVGDANYSGTRPVIWQEELRATAAPTAAFTFYWSRGRIYSAL
jgi:hypothetical protein